MSHQLDPNDIPWPELPKPGEFFNSVWSPEAIRPGERKVQTVLCWLLAATLTLGVVGAAFLWGTL